MVSQSLTRHTTAATDLKASFGSGHGPVGLQSFTLDSLVAGERLPADRYIHTVHADTLLTDAFTWLSRKRQLDRNLDVPGPDDGAIVGRVALADAELMDRAIEAGRQAAPAWAALPASVHREFAERVNGAMERNRERIVELLIAEGHPYRLAQWEMDGVLKGSSRETREFCDTLTGGPRFVDGTEVTLRRRPCGLVGMVPAQNAAASTSLLGLTALAAGNTMIVKPPRSSPLATAWIWQEVVQPELDAVGAPPGTLSVICAPPQAALDRWLVPGGVDALFFVGGSQRGLRLGQRCMGLGIRPVLELSGNDSLVVWKDADVTAAARAAAECFYGSTQICMVPKRVAVHPAIADAFLEELQRQCLSIRPGLPSDRSTLLSPVMDPVGFRDALDEAVAAGGNLVTGGRTIDHLGVEDPVGVFIEPTVIRFDAGRQNVESLKAVQDETFFPLLPVVVWQDGPDETLVEEMIRFTTDNAFGLRNSLWTSSRLIADQWLCRVGDGGILKVNCSHAGFSEIMPTHGGTGLSGGPFGEANYPALTTTRLQAIQINHDFWEGNHDQH